MRAVLISAVVALAAGTFVTWFMTRPFGGGETTQARIACQALNDHAKEAGFDARKEALSATYNPEPSPTPGLEELQQGARQPKNLAELRRLEIWCVGRGFGPTPTP